MHTHQLARALRRGPLTVTVLFSLMAPAFAQSIPGAPRQADMVVDAAARTQLVDGLIREMQQGYVFPEKAGKVAQLLRQQQKSGALAHITSAEKLAKTLTGQLQKEALDKHLLVVYSEQAMPQQEKNRKQSMEEQAMALADMKARNFGIERVERLPFNIGYLDLRGFAPAKDAATTIGAAMTVLANTDSLIIDLRKNGGGDPATVAMIASYLFDQRTRLNDIYFREGDRTEQMWSTEYVAGIRYGQTKDVYLLTSEHTFSAAEDFSYTLKNLKRATIVGETTGGGAHPGDMVRLSAHFAVFIPNGRSISPITKTDWEGTGVAPDVKVPAEDAFKTAQAALLNKLIAATRDPSRIDRIKLRIAAVEQEKTAASTAR
ncbi:MAG: S41 family peptidase [Pseudomonadota bacterium]